MQFILTSQQNDARQADRRAMIPRGLLGDEMEGGEVDGSRERGAIDCRSPKTTATFLEADNDTFLAPNLFSPAAPRGDH